MSDPPDLDEVLRRRRLVVALILLAGLAIAAVLVVQGLHKKSALEDCLMAGRHDCDRLAD